MGGNAFKNLDTCRLRAEDYEAFQHEVRRRLRKAFPSVRTSLPMSYGAKPSHGDLDLLYCAPPEVTPQMLCEALDCGENVVRNGPVTSCVPGGFDVQFQTDLIRVKEDELGFAFGYLSYNDLGNFAGRVARYMGFKLGHRGLFYVVRNPENDSHILAELRLPLDWTMALDFLEYDWNRWNRGFFELDEVFEYAASNPYASRELFRLHNVNHQARVRDKKRKNYSAFLKWAMDPENNVPEGTDQYEETKQLVRETKLAEALRRFESFQDEYCEAMFRLDKQNKVKAKFNGKLVSEWTGLSGKELGAFMKRFKEEKTEDELFSASPKAIERAVRAFQSKWRMK